MSGYQSKKAMARDRSYSDVVEDAIELAYEYMDDCQYTKVAELTAEDKDYLAGLLQMDVPGFELILDEHL